MSRKRQGGQLQAVVKPKIQKILECPICLEIPFSTNVFTCTNGHIICGNCKPKLDHCGICRVQITNTRNLCIEEIIATSTFNCKNNEFGCEVILNGNEMIQHNSQCSFRRFICPLSGRASPSFSSNSLLLHLISAHKAKVLDTTAEGYRDIMAFSYDPETETTGEHYTEEYGPWPCKLLTWTEANFIIQPEMRQNQMYFRIFSINLPKNGGHYFVKIDFRQAGKLKYSVMIEPVPVSWLNDLGMDVTYVQAIIDESVWSNLTEVRDESLVLCVHYSVLKL